MLPQHDARKSSKNERSAAYARRRMWAAIGLISGITVVAGGFSVTQLSAQPADLLPILAAAEQQQPMGNRDRLQRGITEFRNGQYEEALADLQQVKSEELGERDRTQLSDYLSRSEQASNQRKSARAEFEQGEQALNGNKATEAAVHYKSAIANTFADEGTRAKSREQLAVAEAMMRQAGQSMKGLYDQAVNEYKAGQLDSAKEKFQQLSRADYRPGLFQKSPADYVKDIERTSGTAQSPTPAAAPTAAAADPKAIYETARKQYDAGDLANAKTNFQRARELGYRGGLFQDPPDRYLAKIAEREQSAEAAARAQAEAAAMAEAERQRAATAAQTPPTTPTPPAVTQAPPTPAPEPQPVTQAPPPPTPAPTATLPPPEVQPDPRAVYVQARTQYDSGDLAAAKKNFELARDRGYRARLFETSPEQYLSRIADQMNRQELALRQQNEAAFQAAQPAPQAPALDRTEQRQKAAALVDQAETARAAGRNSDALGLYVQAAELDPTNSAAVAGRNQLRGELSPQGGQPGVLDVQEQQNQQSRDFVSYSVRDNLSVARNEMGAGRFDQAQAAIERARVARNINPGVFRPEEIRSFETEIAQAQTALDQQRVVAKTASDEAAQRDLADRQRQDIQIRDDEKARTVADLITQARQMVAEGKFEQAVGVLDHILTLDPKNDYANNARALVEDRAVIMNQRRSRERFDRSVVRQFNAAEEMKIPYSDILRFPDNWPDLTEKRDRTVAIERGVRAEDAVVIAQLERNLPEVRFDAIAFEQVIEFLRDVSGANLFVNWRALETAGVDKTATVSARLRDVKFSKALETILRDVGGNSVKLAFTVDEGVISISTEEDLASNTVTNVYDIQDLIMQVTDFDQPPQFNIQAGGGRGGGGGGALFGGVGQQVGAGQNTRQTLVDQIVQLIQETIARESWRDNGGNVGSIRELSGQLIVTQTPEHQRSLSRLLDQLRETRALQITVEARFLTVQRNFLEEIGVDFDFVLNPNGELSSRLSPISVGNNSEKYTQISSLTTSVPGNIATELVASNSSSAGVTPNFGVSGVNGGAVTFLDDFQVSVLLRATQISQTSTILTAPRLTLFNGQRANVVVSTETAYVSDLTPIVGTNAVAFDPQIGTANSGVLLDVQGTVSSDRKYVTLTLRPTLQRLRSLIPFPVSAISNTPIIGDDGNPTTIVQAFIQQPVLDVTAVQTTVSVPDGATLLLGGQTLAGEIERTSGVPVLSKIPWLKRLFTNQSMSKDEQVLLILVKPTILIQREIEADQFPLLGSRVGG